MNGDYLLEQIPKEHRKFAIEYARIKCEQQKLVCADQIWMNSFEFMDKLSSQQGAQLMRHIESAHTVRIELPFDPKEFLKQ